MPESLTVRHFPPVFVDRALNKHPNPDAVENKMAPPDNLSATVGALANKSSNVMSALRALINELELFDEPPQ